MILYMVGMLATNSPHFARGLIKYVPGRGYYRVVPSQNGGQNCDIPDPPIVERHNIINNNHAALTGRFQPSTLHKLRQLRLSTDTDTPDDNNINNNNYAALAELFQPSTLHKMRQLGLYTNTDTPDIAHQLHAEAVPIEVAYTRTNTQPSCSGERESDRVPNTFKEAMTGPRHHTS